MSICMIFFYIPINLIKIAFVANAKWQEETGFGMVHHICVQYSVILFSSF